MDVTQWHAHLTDIGGMGLQIRTVTDVGRAAVFVVKAIGNVNDRWGVVVDTALEQILFRSRLSRIFGGLLGVAGSVAVMGHDGENIFWSEGNRIFVMICVSIEKSSGTVQESIEAKKYAAKTEDEGRKVLFSSMVP